MANYPKAGFKATILHDMYAPVCCQNDFFIFLLDRGIKLFPRQKQTWSCILFYYMDIILHIQSVSFSSL